MKAWSLERTGLKCMYCVSTSTLPKVLPRQHIQQRGRSFQSGILFVLLKVYNWIQLYEHTYNRHWLEESYCRSCIFINDVIYCKMGILTLSTHHLLHLYTGVIVIFSHYSSQVCDVCKWSSTLHFVGRIHSCTLHYLKHGLKRYSWFYKYIFCHYNKYYCGITYWVNSTTYWLK